MSARGKPASRLSVTEWAAEPKAFVRRGEVLQLVPVLVRSALKHAEEQRRARVWWRRLMRKVGL